MKRELNRAIAAIVFAAFAIGVPAETIAEVSARRVRDRASSIIFSGPMQSITDDPDPIPSIFWEPLGAPTSRVPLNPNGDLRPDDSPYVAYHPGNAWPVAVWAYNNGTDRDIAFSAWNGIHWGPIRFVTSSVDDELDPEAVVTTDGTVHVVWWVDDPEPRVMTASIGATDTSFSVAQRISPVDESATRPSAAVAAGSLWIAYERMIDDGTVPANGAAEPGGGASAALSTRSPLSAFGRADAGSSTTDAADTGGVGGVPPVPVVASQVVVYRRLAGGEFARRLAVDSSRSSELDVGIHGEQGHLWLEWKATDSSFKFVESDSSDWTAPQSRPWTDPAWIGEEDTRAVIRRAVLDGDVAAVDPTESSEP